MGNFFYRMTLVDIDVREATQTRMVHVPRASARLPKVPPHLSVTKPLLL